jgi:eukaryotic-like serine/threonine-protein kinase
MNFFRPSTASSAATWTPKPPEGNARPTLDGRTLDQRLADGRPALAEALRIAMSLADALRRLHEEGRVHGALTPSSIALAASGVELLPPRAAQGLVTPYTAPEVLRGNSADVRSDIFAFGAIVYEMVTGRWPFEADTPEALAAALLNSPAPATGNPALDSLMANCLAKEPAVRWQRIQKVQMELRLATVSTRRADGPPRRDSLESVVRGEVQRAESRLASRLEAQEKALSDLQQAVTASLQAMQAHLCTVDSKLAAGIDRAKRCDEAAAEFGLRISGIEQRLAEPQERIGRAELLLEATAERVARAEHNADLIRKHTTEFAEGAAVQLHALQQTVGSQAEALEAARRAMAQTDDLVERVVEALDSLQSIVLQRSEEGITAVN